MDQLEEVLALDLGGSKLALARVDRAGELLAHTRAPTAGIRGGDDLVAWVRAEVGAWGVDPRALGISAGGPLDDEAGIIVSWPRMEMLWGYPLAASLRAAVPSLERVALVNDASAACAGEVLFGAARGLKRVLYLTVSTGVGGGAVVGGRLLRGDRGNAAEFGHTVVKHDGPRCDCGGPGHLEAMASAAGLYHRYVAAGLCEASERGWAGLGPWLRERLEGGDDYDRKIAANIGRCSFFLPIVSANTQRRLEAYFRREWSYAVDRARNIAEGAVFILPVCVDDTREADAIVPEKFKSVHITRLPDGEPSPEFIRRLQELFAVRRS